MTCVGEYRTGKHVHHLVITTSTMIMLILSLPSTDDASQVLLDKQSWVPEEPSSEPLLALACPCSRTRNTRVSPALQDLTVARKAWSPHGIVVVPVPRSQPLPGLACQAGSETPHGTKTPTDSRLPSRPHAASQQPSTPPCHTPARSRDGTPSHTSQLPRVGHRGWESSLLTRASQSSSPGGSLAVGKIESIYRQPTSPTRMSLDPPPKCRWHVASGNK